MARRTEEETRIANREACARYRAANREKQRLASADYRARNPEKIAAYREKYRSENTDKVKKSALKAYHENRDECLSRNKKYRAENKEKEAARSRRYKELNREKVAVSRRNFRYRDTEATKARERAQYERNRDKILPRKAEEKVLRRQRGVAWSDKKTCRAFYAMARRISKCLGIPHEVDHIIPLRGKFVSGLHVPNNLCVIPMRENRRKGNKVSLGVQLGNT